MEMKTALENILKRMLARPSLALCAHLTVPALLEAMRRLNEIQLGGKELRRSGY